MRIKLSESSTLDAKGVDGLWSVTLLTEGKGSSGTYTKEFLKNYAHVIQPGARSFITHQRHADGEADPRNLLATFPNGARYEEDAETGLGKWVGEYEVLPSWRPFVEEVAKHTALSIFIMGDADADGNVTEAYESVDAGCDLVVYPGRPGSGFVEKLYESYRDRNETAAEPQRSTKKENTVEKKEMEELLESAFGKFADTLASKISESLKPAPVDPEVPTLAAVAEAVSKSGLGQLTEVSQTRVLEALAQPGAKIEDLVSREKAYEESIEAAVKARLEESKDHDVYGGTGGGASDWAPRGYGAVK